MPASSKAKIAIVGAGMGGMALATALHRKGHDFTVYEQAPQFARIGAGIQLSPNVIRVLHGMDLEAPLAEVAFHPRNWRSRDSVSGDVTFEVELGDAMVKRYGTKFLIAHRADLHRVMCDTVPLDKIAFNKKLVGVDPAGSQTRLGFADGTHVLADAVVGADGVHSVIREHLLGPEKPTYTGHVAYRSVFPAALLGGLEIDDNTKWWSDDRHIVIYFLTRRRDEVYFVTGVPEPDWKVESWSVQGTLEELRAAFRDFHPTVRQVVHAAPQVQKWALLERDPLPKWGEGSVIMLGDACHPMLPYMGQGGAMAIEDAAVLARCIDEAGAEDFAGAFRRFEATRRARATRVQKSSQAGQWLRNPEDPSWLFAYDPWTAPLAPVN
jgi:6-hydroxynicotinate 3-monooxygenase